VTKTTLMLQRSTVRKRQTPLVRFALLIGTAIFNVGALSQAADLPTAGRVLVIYNANYTRDDNNDGVQDSLEVAQYYAAKRGVPAANVAGFSFSTDYYYKSFSEFSTNLLTPLKTKLSALGTSNIDILLFVYGTPYLVQGTGGSSIDNAVMSPEYWTTAINGLSNPYFHANPSFTTDKPHFDHSVTHNGKPFYMVARIDHPRGVNGSKELVDQALYADRYLSTQTGAGYYTGIGYVDCDNYTNTVPLTMEFLGGRSEVMSGSYGTKTGADLNIAYIAKHLTTAGFALKWEATPGYNVIGSAAAMFTDGTPATSGPRAIFYGGWYNFFKYTNVWGWLPGSVASDLNSDSLTGHRVTNEAGGGPFLTRALQFGASAVSGVVSEPYLGGHPRSHILLYYMLKGYSFAEASTLAAPLVGWHIMNIGDPLYAPMRPKTIVRDTTFPAAAPGYPQIALNSSTGRMAVTWLLQDSPEPEVARAVVDYGPTTSYGYRADSGQGYWRRLKVDLARLPAGETWHARVTLIDPVGNESVGSDISVSAPAGMPYGGAPATVPGIIQAENFDLGGEGLGYHDVTAGNDGGAYRRTEGVDIVATASGFAVGWSYPGEWLDYTVQVPSAGTYTLELRAASAAAGNKVHVELSGQDVTGTLVIPNTGSLTAFGTVSKSGISLPGGTHVLRVAAETYASNSYLESISITSGDGPADTQAPARPRGLR
jgi:hypothetical protein